MFEYFSGPHRGLVNDISTLTLESLPKTKSRYTADDKKELVTCVTRLINDARISVLEAAVLSAQDAGINGLWGALHDISGLLYKMAAEAPVEESYPSIGTLKTMISCLYRALEDIVKALYSTQRLSPQSHPSTFSFVSEKLENASSGTACAIVTLQDYFATLVKKKESGCFDGDTVSSARRAAFIVTCIMVNICELHAMSTNNTNFGVIAPYTIESAVAISRLISPNTPSFMIMRAAEIAVRKFDAIRANCYDHIRVSKTEGGHDLSDIFADVPTVFVNLVSKHTDADFAADFMKPDREMPDLEGLLLLEGIFYASYAVFLCETSKQLRSSVEDEKVSEINADMKAILDSFYECFYTYNMVREDANSRTSSGVSVDTLMKGLQRIVDIAEQVGKQHETSLPSNVKRFMNTIAICAHRNLDLLSKSETSYSCIWSKSVLSLFPDELPETLKEKTAKGITSDRVYCLISDEKIRSKLSKRTAASPLSENELVYADLKLPKRKATRKGGGKKTASCSDSRTAEQQQTLYTEVAVERVGRVSHPHRAHHHTPSTSSPIYDDVCPDLYVGRGR